MNYQIMEQYNVYFKEMRNILTRKQNTQKCKKHVYTENANTLKHHVGNSDEK